MKVLDDSSCFGGDEQCWPPGFRFHPTDEELVLYYLKRKICRRRLKLDIIAETDVYKWDPEELPGQSKLKTGDRLWFFFSPRDRKYPNGARSNRATRHGYWKATGKDRTITCNSRAVGVKKTLVFYKGRAPTGKRTDWVMHEYTLDEDELKRCQYVQDYYALYKVYKKSGPGPKNGEQYGAPFREEDWADDENTKFIVHAIGENHVKQANDVASVDNTRTNDQLLSPFNDLEELMTLIANDPVLLQPHTADDSFALQAIGEEETQSTFVDQSLMEASLCEKSMVCHQSGHKNDMQASFNLTQSTTSQLQLHETSEVTCAPNIYIQEHHDAEEDFLEDFLELDDLTDPEPTSQNIEKPAEDLQFEGFDGLSELDLYQDAVMFLQDLGPIANGLDSHSYFNNIGNEMVAPVSSSCLNNLENVGDPISHSYLNNFETQMAQSVSHINYSTLGNETGNNLDPPLQPHFNNSSQINSQLWMHDQRCNIVSPAESDHGAVPPPTSGVVYDGSSASFPGGVNQNQNQSGKEDDGRESWFSSTLWAFVESIPTTPASASEGTALMNRAFERMSSFGRMGNRMRISAGDTSVAAVKPPTSLRMPNRRFNQVFLLFSVLGLLCALLWVLTGTSMRILGRCIPSLECLGNLFHSSNQN